MELLVIVGLVLLNGVFAMSELALVSSRKFRLDNARRKGSLGAKTALELFDNPTKFLSTIQIGITLIGILLGVYSGKNLTDDVAEMLRTVDLLNPYADKIAVGIIVVSVTYLSIVLGELFPKRLGMTFPEPITIFLAKPMKFLSEITSPFVWLLSVSNNFLLKIFGIRKSGNLKVSEEEIKSIIKESAEGGEIQDIEHSIVERVFELGDRKVNTLFTYRSDIVFFDITDNWKTISNKINQEKYSAYPVCRNNDIDNVLGIVLLKDLFTPDIEKSFDLAKFIKEPLYLNENAYAYEVLKLFQKEKMHYGVVVDEYGSTQGIVTMDDVVDALVGDADALDLEEYQITQRDENSWFVDGKYLVLDFLKYFAINLDYPINDKFTTVAGLVMYQSRTLPNIGERIRIDHYELEVIDKDGQRIDKILVTKL